MTALVWILRLTMALTLLGWGATWLKVLTRKRDPKWALGPEDPACSPDLLVSIVIPARNEEAHIAGCVQAALAQDHPNLEVVVLNDGSSDRTGEILAAIDDPRLRVLQGGEALPDGWFGKPWALQRAQEHARGDWLFFIDADVRLAPQAVSRVVGYGESKGLGMVTGFGTLTMESFWERVLQPAVGGLILLGNSLDQVNDPEQPDKNMASGQLLAFSRRGYDQAGQHHAVKNNILDDVGLARACVDAQVGYHCLFMRRLYSVRMYTSLQEIWDGWGKNLFAGMHYSWATVAFVEYFLFTSTLLGPILLAVGLATGAWEWVAWGGAHLVLMQGTRLSMDLQYGHKPLYGLSHAPATAMVMALIVHSGIKSQGKGVQWKGRTYNPE
ncbi:MAG: glycosyltransferase family 2 protein [Myxococcota bacterium]|nr:glycosyltransferase family 2 protein [Myxococcota bacterium]